MITNETHNQILRHLAGYQQLQMEQVMDWAMSALDLEAWQVCVVMQQLASASLIDTAGPWNAGWIRITAAGRSEIRS